jgi:hypothetical protein
MAGNGYQTWRKHSEHPRHYRRCKGIMKVADGHGCVMRLNILSLSHGFYGWFAPGSSARLQDATCAFWPCQSFETLRSNDHILLVEHSHVFPTAGSAYLNSGFRCWFFVLVVEVSHIIGYHAIGTQKNAPSHPDFKPRFPP